MSSNLYFDVEVHERGGWRKVEESQGINKLSQAIKLAQQVASRRQLATRVVNQAGKEMDRFEANGQRPGRRKRRI